MTANAWTIAIGLLTSTGTVIMVRTGVKLVFGLVEKAMTL